MLWLYLERETDLFTRPQRVLHVAPESYLRTRLEAVHGSGYVHGDIADPDNRIDVTRLDLPDSCFDVVICSHVLEHVPDDRAAVREFARVLAPGGWAILDAPVDHSRATTYEDAAVTTPRGRRRHFGQWDHVRVYGRDFLELLCSGGLRVDVAAFRPVDEEEQRYGLRPDLDVISVCRVQA